MSSTTLNPTATSTSTATPSCISVVPDKNGYVPEWACDANYSYYPSFGGALFFAVAFGITTFLHIYQAFYYKKWRLCWVIVMGSAWEFASFATRAAGTRNQQSLPLAFVSQILFLLAPMWVNAFDYMVVGRMIYFFVPEQKIWGIRGIKIAKIFVWLDVLSFLTQLGGGALIQPGQDPKTLMAGIHVYMGGIGLQELFILFFTAIGIKFFLTMKKAEASMAGTSNQILDGRPHNWRPLLFALYASLMMITVRIIFRLVEFSAGIEPGDNPIPYTEAYQFCLDALPMLLAISIMNVVHPGRILKGEGSEFPKGPTRKEKKELKRIKKEEKLAKKEEKKAAKEERKAEKMQRNLGV
ncbi:Uncharacterized protein BP5553_04530 [Venustampulla echinocandica]|uniref:RTA1-domain-containing protein n=1 Tax=Venustampulla echinocandica TaxID=2656787 RepID=A0A370TNK6_9HELO|nr:Uncharacterized protein BP5553_04530 [Venustampulla echinocandica]RDL37097.1 Uncharacterized protein BP5553_04530 [Venustampulla echinocandica]